MQPHGRAPHAADHLAVDIQLIGQDPFLGMVELIGKPIGKMVERLRSSARQSIQASAAGV